MFEHDSIEVIYEIQDIGYERFMNILQKDIERFGNITRIRTKNYDEECVKLRISTLKDNLDLIVYDSGEYVEIFVSLLSNKEHSFGFETAKKIFSNVFYFV